MKFTVYEDEWNGMNVKEVLRDSKLLDNNNKMCCMGFVAEQLGIPRRDLVDVPALHTIRSTKNIEHVFDVAAGWVGVAYEINDNINLGVNLEEKKEALINLFAENGHELVFEPTRPKGE